MPEEEEEDLHLKPACTDVPGLTENPGPKHQSLRRTCSDRIEMFWKEKRVCYLFPVLAYNSSQHQWHINNLLRYPLTTSVTCY